MGEAEMKMQWGEAKKKKKGDSEIGFWETKRQNIFLK